MEGLTGLVEGVYNVEPRVRLQGDHLERCQQSWGKPGDGVYGWVWEAVRELGRIKILIGLHN